MGGGLLILPHFHLVASSTAFILRKKKKRKRFVATLLERIVWLDREIDRYIDGEIDR